MIDILLNTLYVVRSTGINTFNINFLNIKRIYDLKESGKTKKIFSNSYVFLETFVNSVSKLPLQYLQVYWSKT